MKIIVVSDSHRRHKLLEDIRMANQDADVFIHCGDFESIDWLPEGWVAVHGNNDFYSDLPDERVLTLDDIKILVTHSHQYYYNSRLSDLKAKAKKLECRIVCFGHTHTTCLKEDDGTWLINPGSLLYNRDGSPCGYVVVIIEKGKIVSVEKKLIS